MNRVALCFFVIAGVFVMCDVAFLIVEFIRQPSATREALCVFAGCWKALP